MRNITLENGHFRTEKKMNNAQIQDIEDLGIKLYENYYVEEALTNGSTMRIFKNRDEVNKVCLMNGENACKNREKSVLTVCMQTIII